MLTDFGKALRDIRITHGHILKVMADNLQMTPAQLSAIECSKVEIPEDFISCLAKVYCLNDNEVSNLNKLKIEVESKERSVIVKDETIKNYMEQIVKDVEEVRKETNRYYRKYLRGLVTGKLEALQAMGMIDDSTVQYYIKKMKCIS